MSGEKALEILDRLEPIVAQSFSLHRLSQKIAAASRGNEPRTRQPPPMPRSASTTTHDPLKAARAGIRAQLALGGGGRQTSGPASIPQMPPPPRRPLPGANRATPVAPQGGRTLRARSSLRDLVQEYRSPVQRTTIFKARPE